MGEPSQGDIFRKSVSSPAHLHTVAVALGPGRNNSHPSQYKVLDPKSSESTRGDMGRVGLPDAKSCQGEEGGGSGFAKGCSESIPRNIERRNVA